MKNIIKNYCKKLNKLFSIKDRNPNEGFDFVVEGSAKGIIYVSNLKEFLYFMKKEQIFKIHHEDNEDYDQTILKKLLSPEASLKGFRIEIPDEALEIIKKDLDHPWGFIVDYKGIIYSEQEAYKRYYIEGEKFAPANRIDKIKRLTGKLSNIDRFIRSLKPFLDPQKESYITFTDKEFTHKWTVTINKKTNFKEPAFTRSKF